ncbi:MAG: 2-hydroxyacid dehydrogenase [Thalassobaculales bacterium]
MNRSVVVLDPLAPASAQRLAALLPQGFAFAHATARGDEHLRDVIAEADYAISGQVPVSGAVLRAGRRLKLLHKWGVGVDNFDLEAARELGIVVARTTGSNAVPVAEFTIGLMLAALRNIAHGHAGLMRGEWRGLQGARDGFMLSRKTVGIIGFGAIGQALARLLAGFGCTILYHKRQPLPAEEEARLGVRYAPLSELLASADVVSLHCPLTDQTAGLIDRAALATMKRTAVLVNVARGGVVVEEDLAAALAGGVIHAAAADVFSIEPVPAGNPLLGLPNMVVTPHLAALAADNFEPTVRRMFANIAAHARGEALPPGDIVVG